MQRATVVAYAMGMAAHAGRVYLVGAGPGDPGLLTLRGQACLARAGAVVYDALVNPVLLSWAPADAERIYVGKQSGRHSLPQDDINALLVQQAERHAHVVRLKGGDPFVFGRGGEEARYLAEAGVTFEVVPGVTAGIAAPAYAGIPVTHRGLTGAACLLTAHGAPGDAASLDLTRLAVDGTLVFYMPVQHLAAWCAALCDIGRAPDTPAAVIAWGTRARQQTVVGTLETIATATQAAGLAAPAVLVVGEVVALRAQLSWFEQQPLFGLRVALTHAPRAHDALEQGLRELGGDVFLFPTVEFAPLPAAETPADPGAFDWIVLASANAVDHLFDLLDQQGRDLRALAHTRLVALGSASLAAALERRHVRPDAQAEQYDGDALVAALRAAGGALDGARVYLPRADVARSSLGPALRAAGAEVVEQAAYRKQAPANMPEAVSALEAFAPHLVVFTNAGAVRHFRANVDPAGRPYAFAALGPVTAASAADAGLEVAVQPATPDVPSLVEAIVDWYRSDGQRD